MLCVIFLNLKRKPDKKYKSKYQITKTRLNRKLNKKVF